MFCFSIFSRLTHSEDQVACACNNNRQSRYIFLGYHKKYVYNPESQAESNSVALVILTQGKIHLPVLFPKKNGRTMRRRCEVCFKEKKKKFALYMGVLTVQDFREFV